MDCAPGKSKCLGKGKLKEMPRKSDLNCHKHAALSEPAHVSIHAHCSPFPPNIHFTCFITFHFFVENHFLQSSTGQGLVTGHWSSG